MKVAAGARLVSGSSYQNHKNRPESVQHRNVVDSPYAHQTLKRSYINEGLHDILIYFYMSANFRRGYRIHPYRADQLPNLGQERKK